VNDRGHLDLDQGRGRREGCNLNDGAGRLYLAEAFEMGARYRVDLRQIFRVDDSPHAVAQVSSRIPQRRGRDGYGGPQLNVDISVEIRRASRGSGDGDLPAAANGPGIAVGRLQEVAR